MKTIHNIYYLTILVLLTTSTGCGCQRQKSTTDDDIYKEFYSGRFSIDANNDPSFTDCATMITMDITVDEGYESLFRQYNDLNIENQEKVIIEFTGNIERVDYNSEEYIERGMKPKISVDSVLNIYKGRDCISDFTLPGIYQPEHSETEAANASRRQTLRLKPNYTFIYTSFGEDGSEKTIKGRWHRNAILTLVLIEEPENSSLQAKTQSFQIIPARESISMNSGGKPLTFKKVYL